MTREDVIKLYQETYETITSSSEQWKRFLDMASNIYRYNFAAQIMIYAQRPDATACAEYEVWSNEMKRRIKYGSKKIAIYDDVTGEQTYLYDISDTRQTKESRPMFNWNLDYFHQKAVLQKLSSALEMDIDERLGFTDNVINMIQQYVRERYRVLEDDYERERQTLGENEEETEKEREKQILLASSSVAYVVMKRCGMSQRILDEKFIFDDISEINKEQMLALGDLSSDIAEGILKEVRNAVKTYDKEHFHEEVKKLEEFIEESREKLLSYDTRIVQSSGYGHREKCELDAVSINIDDRSHDYALVLKKDGVFIVRIRDTRGLNYHDYGKIFDENAVLSYNAELIPFSEAPTDIKYDFIMHSGQYKECISKLKYELAERVKENGRSENTVQNGRQGNVGAGDQRETKNSWRSDSLWNDETLVYERTQKDIAWSAQTPDVSEGILVRDTEPGGGASGDPDRENEGNGRGDREAERRGSAPLGSEDEQYSTQGGGNSTLAADRKLELPAPSFIIYQLKDNVPVDYHFRSFEELQKKGLVIDYANYEEIYAAPLIPGMRLEHIFEKFNFDRPEDFKGHSLSVSDVVVLRQNGQDTAHYTDSIGFVDITKEFLLDKSLKETEQSDKVPTITCEWSEHTAFERGRIYSVAEFDDLMKNADLEWVEKKNEGIKKYGSEEDFYNADYDEEPLLAYAGYAKVKFTVNLPDGISITERQDVGDGYGGVIDFFRKLQYPGVADILANAVEGSYDPVYYVQKENITSEQEEMNIQNVISQTSDIFEDYQPDNIEVPQNFIYTDNLSSSDTPKDRFKRNMEAIRTLKEIESESRTATPEEQRVLSQYVGWGGLSEAFDEHKTAWEKEYHELKGSLSDEEYRTARASTTDAFYTVPEIAGCMYEALKSMGFTGGNILEPSMGIGNFFGSMPERLEKQSKLYGVEQDGLSGRIATLLYPKADITIDGFEKTDYPNDFFDVAIGNVPFGQYKVADKQYDKHNFLIHDYFFAKTLDKVRPGGIIAFITSKGTLDKQNSSVRKYLAQRAELLGAVRLPNTAFKDTAGTEVTSDILFLKKRDRILDIEPEWVHLKENEDGILINQYFTEHPEMIVGKMEMVSGPYGMESTCKPDTTRALKDQLREAISHIDGKIDVVELAELENPKSIVAIPADPNVRNFSYTIVDDKVYYRENSVMQLMEVSDTVKQHIRGMIGLRDCTRELIDLQLNEYPDDVIKEKQMELNVLYDDFIEKYGFINSQTNKRAFNQDSSYCLLCSLEKFDDEGDFKGKADMFTKRTIKKVEAVTSVDTANEALAVSLSEKARVDFDYMAELTGKEISTIKEELAGIVFRNPMTDVWETADEYLSGNVRSKLKTAETYAENHPEYEINVQALKQVQPKELDASEIEVRIGATWIPSEYVEQFMQETFETPQHLLDRNIMGVQYSDVTGQWNVKGKNADRGNTLVNVTYGTSRRNAYMILEDSLNLKDSQIYDTIEEGGKEKRILNKKETTIASQKQERIRSAFKEWIFRDRERRQVLVGKYNQLFNSSRPREYDGSHLVFPGMTPDIELKPHQKNAVAHVLYGDNTLLAHCVGAGKTFEMTAAAMESKRLGLCQKSLFVVPNHLTEQWASDFLRLYPGANILAATKKDFEPANRKKFCSRIATGDYDAVIIGHSQFEKIPLSQERQAAVIERQIDEIELAIEQAKNDNGEHYTIKQMEKSRKSLQTRLQKLNDTSRKDNVVTFEQLGVDRLFVDESHNYKNLFLYTKMRNVAGIAQTEAQKSSDMYAKCQYMDDMVCCEL